MTSESAPIACQSEMATESQDIVALVKAAEADAAEAAKLAEEERREAIAQAEEQAAAAVAEARERCRREHEAALERAKAEAAELQSKAQVEADEAARAVQVVSEERLDKAADLLGASLKPTSWHMPRGSGPLHPPRWLQPCRKRSCRHPGCAAPSHHAQP